jgi:hypothetical protein
VQGTPEAKTMSKLLTYDKLTAVSTAASVLLSAVAVVVTLHVAYVQDRASERESEYSRALGYADIYFSDTVTNARETLEGLYNEQYKTILNSADPNVEVAGLLKTNAQQLMFDRLLAVHEQIAACANTSVCSPAVTQQLYGHDMQALYQNWYGYIVRRRAYLRADSYGCQVAKFIGKTYSDPPCPP